MFTLHWIFINDHAYTMGFNTLQEAESYAWTIDIDSPTIKKAFIKSNDEIIYLKGKP